MQQPSLSKDTKDGTFDRKSVMEDLNDNLQRLSVSLPQTLLDTNINKILKEFISRMQNMFDNYVCFSGERDTAQQHKLYGNASQYVKSAFQHNSVQETDNAELCYKVCSNIFEIFQQENREIEKHEAELFKEMSAKLISAYLRKISVYLPSLTITFSDENNVPNLTDIHEILVDQLVKLALDSFNIGDKGNFVLYLFIENLKKSLNSLFQQIVSISTDISNQETFQAESSIIAYKHCMQDFENSNNWHNYQHVRDLHSKTLLQVTKTLPKTIQEDVQRRLYTYFLYLYQHYSERIDNHIKDSRALCIQLSPSFIRVGFHTISGDKSHWQDMCPHLFIRHNNSKTNRLAERHILYHIKHCMVFPDISRKLLVEFFRLNYNEQGKHMVQGVKQLIVIIPSWLTIEQRHFLRSCARFAKYEQVYFAHESSLAAYQWLNGQKTISSDKNYTFVQVSVDKVGVQVEIFALNEQGKLLLLALSCNCWEEPELNCSKFFGGCYHDFGTKDTIPEHFSTIVSETFEKASSQVPIPYNSFVKACVVKAESVAWREHVNVWFREREHLIEINDCLYELAFHSALKFSHSASKIRKQILDHATHVNSSTTKKNDDVEQTVCLNTADAASKTCTSGNTDEQLVHERKKMLLNRCMTLECTLEQSDINVVAKRKLIKVLTEIQSKEFLNTCDKNKLEEKEKILDKISDKLVSK